jgi:hypothetical protein
MLANAGQEIQSGPSFDWPVMCSVSKTTLLHRSRFDKMPRRGCVFRTLVVTRFAHDLDAVLSVQMSRCGISGTAFRKCVARVRI